MAKMVKGSDHSVQNLAKTIHSLLGMNTHLNSNWISSVCDILQNLPSMTSSSDPFKEDDEESEGMAISKLKVELSMLKNRLSDLNLQRKKLLNDYLDLKGNIRVFCRIRPINTGEVSKRVRAMDSSKVVVEVSGSSRSRSYSFDTVFHPSSTQDDVFKELEPVIKSALDGYNACIFAYGQTGTGKTFTMEGNQENPGVVPRTIQELFKQASNNNNNSTNLFTFSMLEIYLGNLKDLLVPQPTKATEPMPPWNSLTIQTDPKGGIDIENLAAIAVSDYSQAIRLYKLGCHFRSTASTDSNMASSRSHCLIRISITCFGAPERRRETNKIWLVDLGGSERVLKTRASGKRLDEGKAINLSLSALGDVIHALQRKKGHIPFRNSKLTQVLKDCLGEDSKTLMLVHVSPKEEDLCETICTLNFAARVRSVRLGNEDSLERAEKEAEMQNLQEIMEKVEIERQTLNGEIKKVTGKLKLLTKEDPSTNGEDNITAEPSQFNPNDKTRNIKASPSSKLRGFMKPTVCSQRKTGSTYQTFEGIQLTLARRRKPPSQRAKSVTFPFKGDSENNSQCSLSRASCLGDLNLHNVDSETVYSQDVSDCDVRVEEKKTQAPLHERQDQKHRFQNMSNKSFSQERLKVDNWLKSREPKSRQIPHIPLAPRKIRSNVQNQSQNVNTKDVASKVIGTNDKKEENIGEGDDCSSIYELESNKSASKSVDSVITDDGLICTRDYFAASLVLEDEIKHQNEIGYGELTDTFGSKVDIMRKTQILESSMPNNRISVMVSHQCESTYELIDLQDKDSRFSSKLNTIVDPNIERRTGPLKFRRALFMENEDQKDGSIYMQFVHKKVETENRGIYDLLKEKIQIVCVGFLLGLGLRSTGFKHDFFNALTL